MDIIKECRSSAEKGKVRVRVDSKYNFIFEVKSIVKYSLAKFKV